MKTKTQQKLAVMALPLALCGIGFGLAGNAAANAAPAPVPSGSPVAQAATPSATTKTIPWCGWTIANLPSSITLRDSSISGDAQSKYKGLAIDLVGTASNISAFVGGTTAYSSEEDNCSWYNDANKQGLQLDVAAGSTAFTASAETGGADTQMGFKLDSNNKLSITPTYESNCADGFSTDTALSIYEGHVTTIPVQTVSKTGVNTTSACTWTLNYAAQIPAGMSPKFGDEVYTFTGPTLTTTVGIN